MGCFLRLLFLGLYLYLFSSLNKLIRKLLYPLLFYLLNLLNFLFLGRVPAPESLLPSGCTAES
ncbi:MAG: hypothetical protein Q9N34_10215, partial [Aquificota bacterium]|nr:hypothetical protein [Aquificota bacterium]